MSDELSKITDKYSVIIPMDDPSPVAFINVFEKGDVWVKKNSCLDCPEERRAKCCGNCYWFEKGGNCHWHMGHQASHSNKPFHCIITPSPDDWNTNCFLEYECIEGSLKGKIRRVRDKRETYVEKTETTA